jgi:hypothetical protein
MLNWLAARLRISQGIVDYVADDARQSALSKLRIALLLARLDLPCVSYCRWSVANYDGATFNRIVRIHSHRQSGTSLQRSA